MCLFTKPTEPLLGKYLSEKLKSSHMTMGNSRDTCISLWEWPDKRGKCLEGKANMNLEGHMAGGAHQESIREQRTYCTHIWKYQQKKGEKWVKKWQCIYEVFDEGPGVYVKGKIIDPGEYCLHQNLKCWLFKRQTQLTGASIKLTRAPGEVNAASDLTFKNYSFDKNIWITS